MPDEQHLVLVTGIGVVSTLGRGVDALWQALIDGGAAASARVESYSAPPNLDADAQSLLGRCSLLAVDAAIQAVEDARMPFTAQTAPLIGIVIGSEHGDSEKPVAGAPATSLARVLGVAGPVISLCGPGSGLAAVAQGFELIRRGAAPVVIVGGADVLPANPATATGRPFDVSRDGPRPSEGACVLVLEDEEIATTREARVHAQVLGAGMAFSRATVMSPGPNFIDAARAMRAALLRAEVFQGEVEALFASASGDRAGDDVEARAMKDLWGPNVDRLTVTSVLGATGQSGAAAGVLSLAAALRSLSEGVVPATTGCTRPDDAFSVLDIVLGGARNWRFNTAMVNALSEGTSVSVVVRKE